MLKTLVHRPLITEKSMGLASRGWYTFAVDKQAEKPEVAREIEKTYHVNVLTVRMVAMHGKVRRTGKKMVSNHRPDWKKAIVLLKDGQHIDAFEVSAQAPEAASPAPATKAPGKEPKVESENVEESKSVRAGK